MVRHRLIKRDSLAALTLGGPRTARVIHENAPHGLRCNPVKVRAILPRDLLLPHQPHVGLTHQRRGLQRVVLTLAAHEVHRECVQFMVDQRRQLVGRTFSARLQRFQQTGHLVRRFRCSHGGTGGREGSMTGS